MPEAPKDRACRFCTRKLGQATFEKIAHVIPKSLCASTEVTSLEECDECNGDGSPHEQDLANFVAHDRLVYLLESRHPSTCVAPNLRVTPDEARVLLNQELDPSWARPLENRRGIVFKMTLHRFRKVGLAKALIRMALFVVPAHYLRRHLRPALDWLRGQNQISAGEITAPGQAGHVTIDASMLDDKDVHPGITLSVVLPDAPTGGDLLICEFKTGKHRLLAKFSTGIPQGEPDDPNELITDSPLEFALTPVGGWSPPSDDEIRGLAYQLWCERGRPEGDPERDWLVAELRSILPALPVEPEEYSNWGVVATRKG